MRRSLLFILSAVGLLLGIYSAYMYGQQPQPQPPLFNPASNPYSNGIYAQGIIESDQVEGENINIYPEVSGPIAAISVAEGQGVQKGDPLFTIESSVQLAAAAQQQAQAEAAQALLAELQAEPRPETLNIAQAQVTNAEAAVRTAQDEFDKQQHVYHLDPDAVSKETLDNDRDALHAAATNLEVVKKQYELVKAGAWSYDIANQEKQYVALSEGLRGIRCAFRQIHYPGSRGWDHSIHCIRGRKLCIANWHLRHVHSELHARDGHGRA